MPATLFLQSEIQNPFRLYKSMLRNNPVFWDDTNRLWALYSYKSCRKILSNSDTYIPVTNPGNRDGLNEYALLILQGLARLNNGAEHEIARQTAMLLFDKMKTSAIQIIVEQLLRNEDKKETDWVCSICKKLPVMAVLKSFGFNKEDGDFIASKIEQLVKIMLPTKTREQAENINECSKQLYTITEKCLLDTSLYKNVSDILFERYKVNTDKVGSLCVSNLVGLFIQSFDAGRGILSNSLLQVVSKNNPLPENITQDFIRKAVMETMRFDPPIHNTRRVAAEDILLNNVEIKKGEVILLVLAAANRDPLRFDNPDLFDIERTNNHENLAFGFGGHACIAKQFSIGLAAATLAFIFQHYKTIRLLEKNIQYEPLINARLPKSMMISLK